MLVRIPFVHGELSHIVRTGRVRVGGGAVGVRFVAAAVKEEAVEEDDIEG